MVGSTQKVGQEKRYFYYSNFYFVGNIHDKKTKVKITINDSVL